MNASLAISRLSAVRRSGSIRLRCLPRPWPERSCSSNSVPIHASTGCARFRMFARGPRKYRQGLVVIGVHTPEFGFEKKLENVRRAAQQMKLDFPIAVDNDYAIWRAFNNRHWPALYFIDALGRLRRHHFGEGEYEQSEMAIQQLLAETGAKAYDPGLVSVHAAGVELPADWQNLKSPEIYLGHDRTEHFSSPGGAALGRPRAYAAPPRLDLNRWALAGEWTMANQATVLNRSEGRIVCRFHARDVHLVMGPPRPESAVRFRVSMDGRPPGPAGGLDVDDSWQWHRSRAADVSAHKATGADRRPHLRDPLPRCRR